MNTPCLSEFLKSVLDEFKIWQIFLSAHHSVQLDLSKAKKTWIFEFGKYENLLKYPSFGSNVSVGSVTAESYAKHCLVLVITVY